MPLLRSCVMGATLNAINNSLLRILSEKIVPRSNRGVNCWWRLLFNRGCGRWWVAWFSINMPLLRSCFMGATLNAINNSLLRSCVLGATLNAINNSLLPILSEKIVPRLNRGVNCWWRLLFNRGCGCWWVTWFSINMPLLRSCAVWCNFKP